jgi:hypothetical protein
MARMEPHCISLNHRQGYITNSIEAVKKSAVGEPERPRLHPASGRLQIGKLH